MRAVMAFPVVCLLVWAIVMLLKFLLLAVACLVVLALVLRG